jgi:hypothetical protein
MKKESILQILLICLIIAALFSLSSCSSTHQACAALVY